MVTKIILVILALGLVVGGYSLYWFQKSPTTKTPQFTHFSVIDESLYQQAQMTKQVNSGAFDTVLLSSEYPAKELKDEIHQLKSLTDARTEIAYSQYILESENVLKIQIDQDSNLENYIGRIQHPLRNEIYVSFVEDLQAVVAREKIKHNIARPMQIDLSINSPIPTPNTPSYPSMFAAEATLISGILKNLLSETEYVKISEKIENAIERERIFGVSTAFDIDYGRAIAEAYLEVMMDNFERKEFFDFVREKDRSNSDIVTLSNSTDIDLLPDVQVLDSWVDVNGTVISFNSDIENIGSVSTPPILNAVLEIDQFSDGIIDKRIDIPFAKLLMGDARTIGYSLVFPMPGDHTFRFVINPDVTFLESHHQNNFGTWTQFSI